MKIGPAVRRAMSPAMERWAAGIYRSVFVDLSEVAKCLAGQLPADASLLDIGGGDGELLNRLLDLRPDVCVTMVDVAGSVGKFVQPRYRDRVRIVPSTLVEDHVADLQEHYDAALVSDVMHHLPISYRAQFLRSLHSSLLPGGAIYIKDIEPGHFISGLSLFCDKYVSGDRGVALISKESLRALANEQLPAHETMEIGLYEQDRPNYILKLQFSGSERGT